MAYTCQFCKSYVPDGTLHTCTGFWGGTTPTQTTYAPWFDNAALQRIAAALERIAMVLETPKRAVRRRG